MSADYLAAAAQDGEQTRTEAPLCSAPSCWDDATRVRVAGRVAVLCETHRKAFLGVSS